MSLISDIEDRLLNFLKSLLRPVIEPLEKLWSILKGFFTAIVQVIPATIDLVKSTYAEVQGWRTFRQGINFKSGVVNLQSARDGVGTIVDDILNAWHSLVDLFTGGFRRVALKPFEDAEAAVTELEELFSGFEELGLREFLQNIGPKLKKAGGKVFEVLAVVQAVAEELLHVVGDLQAIVNASRDIRELFQTGEGLFLKQTNRRRKVGLREGGSINLRVGKLHQL
jgi:hypothetical protein